MRRLFMMMTAAALLAGWTGYGRGGGADIPKPTGLELSTRVADLESKGDAARSQKAYFQALGFYHSAVRLDPKNAVLYNKMGLTEVRLGEWNEAHSYFEKAAKLNPKDPYLFNN